MFGLYSNVFKLEKRTTFIFLSAHNYRSIVGRWTVYFLNGNVAIDHTKIVMTTENTHRNLYETIPIIQPITRA